MTSKIKMMFKRNMIKKVEDLTYKDNIKKENAIRKTSKGRQHHYYQIWLSLFSNEDKGGNKCCLKLNLDIQKISVLCHISHFISYYNISYHIISYQIISAPEDKYENTKDPWLSSTSKIWKRTYFECCWFLLIGWDKTTFWIKQCYHI